MPPNTKQVQQSFVGGVLSPRMLSHIADPTYAHGLQIGRNMIIEPTGAAQRRPGLGLVKEVKDSTKKTRVIEFKFSRSQALIVELGAGYFRWHSGGATLLHATGWLVTAVDTANAGSTANSVAFNYEHSLTDGTAVRIIAENGATLPTAAPALSDLTTYYAKVLSSTRIQIYTDVGLTSQVDLQTAGSGAFRVFVGSTVPREWIASQNVLTVNLDTETFSTASAHKLQTGDAITFTSDHFPPEPLTIGVTYYAIVASGTTFKVAATAADAAASVAIALVGRACTIDGGSDTITLTSHTFLDGEQVTFGNPGLPAELIPGTAYYVINAGINTFQVSNTLAGPVKNISNGTGVVTVVSARLHRDYATGDMVYWPGAGRGFYTAALQQPIECTVDLVADTIEAVAHGLVNGMQVAFTTTGTLPTNLSSTVQYYVVNKTDDDFQVSTSFGGSASTFSGTQSGIQRVAVQRTLDGGPPAASRVWHLMPNDGTYEIANRYTEAELWNITYAGSKDVLTLQHQAFGTWTLRRYSATRWAWQWESFAAAIQPPTGLSATANPGERLAIYQSFAASDYMTFGDSTQQPHLLPSGQPVYVQGLSGVTDGYYIFHAGQPPAGGGSTSLDGFLRNKDTGEFIPLNDSGPPTNAFLRATSTTSDEVTHYYVVTAVNQNGIESLASAEISVVNVLKVSGAYNEIAWSAVAGAVAYRIYRKSTLGHVFGKVGEATASPFQDRDYDPLLDQQPLRQDQTLLTNAARAVCYYQQRKLFGGAVATPQTVLATRTGTEADFGYHTPVQDDDRLEFELAYLESVEIRHLVPLAELVALTDGAEFRITGAANGVLSPGSLDARSHTQVGCSFVRPLVVGDVVVFVCERTQHVHELGLAGDSERLLAPDLSLRAQHLFDSATLLDAAAMRAPFPVLFWPSSNGKLVGLTYAPIEKVGAWHEHDTAGSFESVAVIPEGGEDRLYAVVKRTINGQTRRFVERMGSLKDLTALSSAFYVDCGLTLTTSAAVSVIQNLEHLEGQSVQVLANGVVQPSRVVSGGRITLKIPLPAGSNTVHVGLGSQAWLQPVRPTVQVDGFGQGRRTNVSAIWLRMLSTASFKVGPSVSLARTDASAALRTAPVKVTMAGVWGDDQAPMLVQDDPLPLGCAGLVLDLVIGG